MIVTTANDIQGHTIVEHLGIVRGVTVRSRNIVMNFFAGIQSIFGGNITLYTTLAEHARQEAYDLMVSHALDKGANAIICMRYESNEIMPGNTEVLAYGTAVVAKPDNTSPWQQ